MFKRIGNALTFFILVTLLLLNGTSRSFIHQFVGHKDTVDHLYSGNVGDHHEAFEPQHHHCAFLHFVTPVYHPTQENFQITFIERLSFAYSGSLIVWFTREREHTALRGPPKVLFI